MTYTFHQLQEKTVAELREIASGLQHEAVQGYSQMNKGQYCCQLYVRRWASTPASITRSSALTRQASKQKSAS